MNEIVRRNYPASRLPEDLREGIDPQASVTVTVVRERKGDMALPTQLPQKDVTEKPLTTLTPAHFSRFRPLRRSRFQTEEELEEHLHALRDEWAHR